MFIRLEKIVNWFTYSLLNLETSNHRATALNFFIYDSIKILILLIVIIYIMTLINSYLPIEKIRTFLTKRKRYWLDYFFASIFGTITPFCSCSSIPIFIGFLKAWIPLWVIFSFLISSPLVDSVAIALLLGMFGLKITVIYVISWIVLWIIIGNVAYIPPQLQYFKWLLVFFINMVFNKHIKTSSFICVFSIGESAQNLVDQEI